MTSVRLWVKAPVPVGSDWVVTESPLAEVVITDFEARAPLMVAVMVSVRLPSAPSTVVSVWLWVGAPLPVRFHWVVFDSPLAAVLTTNWSVSLPESVMVLVEPPSAFKTVTSVRVWEYVPELVASHWVVFDSPLAAVVITVRSLKAPLSMMVSVVPPLAPSTVTSERVSLNAPPPVALRWVVTDRPLALAVVTLWSLTEPSALRSVVVVTVWPLAPTAVVVDPWL